MADFQEAFASIGEAVSAAERFGEDPGVDTAPGATGSGESGDGAVHVLVSEGRVIRIDINEYWAEEQPTGALANSVTEAVNAALEDYQANALEALEKASVPFAELQRIISESQDKLRSAFDTTVRDAVARAERDAAAGWPGVAR